MRTPKPISKTIDRCIEAQPVIVGTRTLQPVVRVRGWQLGDESGVDGWNGALLRLTAHEIIVREDAQTHTVTVTDPLAEPMRQMARQALLLSGFCLLIMLLARWLERRRKRR